MDDEFDPYEDTEKIEEILERQNNLTNRSKDDVEIIR